MPRHLFGGGGRLEVAGKAGFWSISSFFYFFPLFPLFFPSWPTWGQRSILFYIFFASGLGLICRLPFSARHCWLHEACANNGLCQSGERRGL